MHPRSLILALAIVASCSSSASRSSDTRATDEAAIKAAMKAYAADLATGDVAKIMAWWTDDAIYIDHAKPTIRSRAALDSSVKEILTTVALTSASVETDDVLVSGDLATVVGRYDESVRPRAGGAEVHDHGRFMLSMQRQADGSWKIAQLVGTDLPGGAAAPKMAEKDSSRTRG